MQSTQPTFLFNSNNDTVEIYLRYVISQKKISVASNTIIFCGKRNVVVTIGNYLIKLNVKTVP